MRDKHRIITYVILITINAWLFWFIICVRSAHVYTEYNRKGSTLHILKNFLGSHPYVVGYLPPKALQLP